MDFGLQFVRTPFVVCNAFLDVSAFFWICLLAQLLLTLSDEQHVLVLHDQLLTIGALELGSVDVGAETAESVGHQGFEIDLARPPPFFQFSNKMFLDRSPSMLTSVASEGAVIKEAVMQTATDVWVNRVAVDGSEGGLKHFHLILFFFVSRASVAVDVDRRGMQDTARTKVFEDKNEVVHGGGHVHVVLLAIAQTADLVECLDEIFDPFLIHRSIVHIRPFDSHLVLVKAEHTEVVRADFFVSAPDIVRDVMSVGVRGVLFGVLGCFGRLDVLGRGFGLALVMPWLRGRL